MDRQMVRVTDRHIKKQTHRQTDRHLAIKTRKHFSSLNLYSSNCRWKKEHKYITFLQLDTGLNRWKWTGFKCFWTMKKLKLFRIHPIMCALWYGSLGYITCLPIVECCLYGTLCLGDAWVHLQEPVWPERPVETESRLTLICIADNDNLCKHTTDCRFTFSSHPCILSTCL